MFARSPLPAVRRAVLCALFGVGMSIAAGQSNAQSTDAPAPASDESADHTSSRGQVEEIVVTARKQQEDLQEAPLAVSAISAEALERQNIVRLDRVADLVPNLDVGVTPGGSTSANIYIRGIGTFDFTVLVDPPVATYIDGVLYPRPSSQLFDLVDLERVEVLRGPQGTLFGRNTTGGAINIITKGPADEFGIQQKVGYGTDDEITSRTILNTGLLGASGIKAKIAYNHHERDGYVRDLNRNDAHSPGALDSDSFWVAVEGGQGSVTFDYKFDYSDMHARQVLSQTAYTTPDVLEYFSRSPQFGGDPFIVSTEPLDEVYISRGPDEHYKSQGHSLTLNFEASEGLTLRNIAAYREIDENPVPIPITGQGNLRGPVLDPLTGTVSIQPVAAFDIPGPGPVPGGAEGNIQKQHQFSNELQALGTAGALRYVAGLYYFKEAGSLFNHNFFTSVLPGGDLGINLTNTRAADITTESYAGYTQASYLPASMDERLELTLGLRYTHDEKEIDEDSLFNGAPSLTREESESWSNLSGLASASYHWSDQLMTYLRVATAYRAGGYSAGNVGSFDPEKAIVYETGLKSDWLDRRVRFNAAVFRTNYRDLQVQQQVLGLPRISNAGKANYTGGELELTAIPADGWQIDASLGYVEPDYEQYLFVDTNGDVLDLADEAKFNGVSKLNYNVGLQYQFAPSSVGSLTARVDYIYRSKKYWAPLTRIAPFNEEVAAGAYDKLNARLVLDEVEMGSTNLRFELWGENLLDEEIRTGGNEFGALGFGTVNYGRGRTVGINVTADFF